MKVSNFAEMIGRRNSCFHRLELRTFVGIVSKNKAEEQPWHHLLINTMKERNVESLMKNVEYSLP
jgi:hypothetical protein